MSIFQDITITWKGKDYIVKADRVMGLVDVIEDHITLEELNSPNIKRAKLSFAYAAVINYAGGKADLEEVYSLFFGEQTVYDVVTIIQSLLSLMIPPEHLRSDEKPEEKKEEPA